MNRFSLAVASVSLLTPSLTAAFDGPYAPELWTFTSEAGGFIDEHTPDTLVLVSGDIGFAGDTDMVVTAVASGTWSFDWSFFFSDLTDPFESAYYLINGVEFYISSISPFARRSGSIAVQVQAGDVIGYRLFTADGIFGPGTLTITNFSAPVPAPPAFAFILVVLGSPCRRRRYDSRDGG